MTNRSASVIVCTHNRADLLPGIISRLRAQDYRQDLFEIIVVDNCSTDHTPEIVQRFICETGAPVRYVAENRPGVTYARNRGAQEASYPYVVYLDDDCTVETNWLSQLLSGFDLYENVAVVGGRVVLDWSYSKKPAWIGSGLEKWLGANSNLGNQPALLDEKTQVMESNMAITREAWRSAGGFLGMNLFGSRHMAAGEIHYLLHQIHQLNSQVVYVPQAAALHRMDIYTRRRFLQRGFWQGVTDGIIDYFIYRRPLLTTVGYIFKDASAMLIFLGFACFSYLKLDQANGMFHLVRSTRRLSLVLCRMHILGDWAGIRSWLSNRRMVNEIPGKA